jgi:EAL domain-containing protein (putative c-di-GMP-specific phosphodiesterase class I)
MGCDFAQGYAIGRPMAGDAVADWMAGERLQA